MPIIPLGPVPSAPNMCALYRKAILPSDRSPEITVQAPAILNAWERADARVFLRNVSDQPILPVCITLSTARGPLASWGIEGRSQRWAQRVRGRRGEAGNEILLGPELQTQQFAGPPSILQQEANMDWIRMEPLFPGRSIELNAHFEAAYQYGDHLDADLVYLNLNPNDRLICRVSAGHSGAGFAPCSRVTNFTSVTGAEVYMPAKELERGRLAANASAPLHIQHPEFDIADARLRAGVKEGPFGYSRSDASLDSFEFGKKFNAARRQNRRDQGIAWRLG